MRLIVFGSRTYANSAQVSADLKSAYSAGYRTLVHGACPTGADSWAAIFGPMFGFEMEPHPADWKQFGKRAGPLRNREMAQLGASAAIGYRDPGKSDGTDGMRAECVAAGIPTLLRGTGWP